MLASFQQGWALSLEAARWARSTVWSRSFTVQHLCGKRSAVALVPVLDMIDHSPDVEVVWHTGPDGAEDFQFAPLTAVVKVGSVCLSATPQCIFRQPPSFQGELSSSAVGSGASGGESQ